MTNRISLPKIAAAAVMSLASWAEAAPLFVGNHSFEDPETDPNTVIATDTSTSVIPFWEIYGVQQAGYRYWGVVNPNETNLYYDDVPDGSNIGVTFFYSPNNVPGGLVQTLSDTLQLNTSYTLTVAVGNMATDTSLEGYFNFNGFPGYRVELLAGGVVVASDDNTLAPAEGRFLTSTVTLTTGSSHAQSGTALGIRLVNLNGTGIEVNFDDVHLDATAVPEPSTAALLLGGTVLALTVARFKRKDA